MYEKTAGSAGYLKIHFWSDPPLDAELKSWILQLDQEGIEESTGLLEEVGTTTVRGFRVDLVLVLAS